jgi:hypothetical protein
LPVIAALFLEITSGAILLMIVFLILHEATAIWDVHYAAATREVTPTEQHVHSFFEILPLMGLPLVIALYWTAFAALFGAGTPDFSLRLKDAPLPVVYIAAMLAPTALFEVLPYLEKFIRTLRIAVRPQRMESRSRLYPPPRWDQSAGRHPCSMRSGSSPRRCRSARRVQSAQRIDPALAESRNVPRTSGRNSTSSSQRSAL